jgi:predicted aspartyl protease/transposase InsO family protein
MTSGSGSVAVSSRVPVAQLVDLSNSVGPPVLSPFNRSDAIAQPSRRSSIPVSRPPLPNLATETPMRSLNPFVELAHEQTWSQADALLRTSRDRVTADGDQRSHVSFVPEWSNMHVLSSWPNEQASSTPFPRVRPSYDDYQQPFSSSNPFGPSVSPAAEINPNRMPKAEIESRKFDERADHNTSHLAALSERKAAIKVDKYDGSSCIETFLLKFDHIARYNNWQDSDKAAHLAAALTGSAGLILWNLPVPTYEELVSRLRQRYGSTEQREKFRHELRARRRKRDENLQEMAQDIERLAALAYPDDPQTTRDRLGIEAFIEALNDPELICKIREREPSSLQSALSTAMKLEILHRARDAAVNRSARPVYENRDRDDAFDQTSKRKERRPPAPIADHCASISHGERNASKNADSSVQLSPREDLQSKLDEALRERCAAETESRKLRAEIEALRLQQPPSATYSSFYPSNAADVAPAPPVSVMTNPPVQTIYGAPVANANQFPMPTYQQPVVNSSYIPVSNNLVPPVAHNFHLAAGNTPRCYGCGDPSHFRRDCPRRRAGPNQPFATSHFVPNQSSQARCVTGLEREGCRRSDEPSRRTYLPVIVNGRHFDCLLDTGCETSVVPPSMAEGLSLEPASRKLMAANGSEIPVKGIACITSEIDGMDICIRALVSDHVFDPMLGIDWLEDNKAIWDFAKGQIRIRGMDLPLKSRPDQVLWSRRVMLAEDVVIPSSSELDVETYLQCRTLDSVNDPSGAVWISEPHTAQPGVVSARAVVPDRLVKIPMRVINVNQEPARLRKGCVVAELQPAKLVTPDVESSGSNGAELHPVLEELVSRIDPSVPESSARDLRELIGRYRDAFSTGSTDLGRTDLVVHSIDTNGAQPFRQPLRRHPIAYRAAIDEQLTELLEQGVIEPCQSPYASNLVLVRKKDGSIRCCVDFRQLNLQTRRDAYPLPRADACLEAMSGASWFSTFDMRSGYHQVCVDERDLDKTAFVCHRGLFRYRMMPFGLNNAGATFQRLMDLVLSGLTLEICLVYLDDIIVYSSTLEQHLERLRIVLDRVSRCGMKLKTSKCALMQKSVHFLGHVISGDGVATDPEKVRLVEQWPVPANLGELRSFLGLTGYYRRYVDGYSRIVSPLTELTQKGRQFIWSETCQRAFETLKQKLSSPPVLAMPNDQDTFVLDTDASDRSIGAVLTQLQDGHERVIAYAGRCLNRAESNYCITRKELLAVVNFVKHFRHFLIGKPFILRTDHAALTWLNKTRDPIGQNARWLEQLGEYTFEIQHRPGTRHGNADALSRRPCPPRSPCTACRPKDETAVKCRATKSTPTQSFFDEPAGHPADWSVENVKQAQASDPDLSPLLAIGFPNGDRPPYSSVEHLSSSSKSLWYQWERMYVYDGLLYRQWESPDGLATRGQLYIPKSMRNQFLQLVHSGMTGGHLGRSKTEDQVSRRAYWPSWTSDVRFFLKCCENCARFHRGKPPKQTKLKPFLSGEPFELISIDITGPHPPSRKGNQFILTVVDHFSKWAEAFAIRNHHADTVARQLTTHVFSRFGVPKRLLSDRGPEFESRLFAEVCRLLKIDKLRTTSFKASTNGVVERFHSTLNSCIAKVVDERHRDWDECLPLVLAAYRSSRHESTGYSPNFLLFGRENRAPADLVLPDPDASGIHESCINLDQYASDLRNRTETAYRLVREHLGVAANRRKETYDQRVTEKSFQPGDRVWFYYPRKRKGLSPKWASYYTGPMEVVRVVPPCNYVVRRSYRSKPFVVHGDKLKACVGRSSRTDDEAGDTRDPNELIGRPRRVTDTSTAISRGRPSANPSEVPDGLGTLSPAEFGAPVRRGVRPRRPPRPFSPS